jgi:hypothetical protein
MQLNADDSHFALAGAPTIRASLTQRPAASTWGPIGAFPRLMSSGKEMLRPETGIRGELVSSNYS